MTYSQEKKEPFPLPETLRSNLIQAAVAMGYRALDEDQLKWAKPLGCSLLLIELDRSEITQFFKAYTTGEMCRWSTSSFETAEGMSSEGFTDQIVHYEVWSANNSLESPETFAFTADQDWAELVCDGRMSKEDDTKED